MANSSESVRVNLRSIIGVHRLMHGPRGRGVMFVVAWDRNRVSVGRSSGRDEGVLEPLDGGALMGGMRMFG